MLLSSFIRRLFTYTILFLFANYQFMLYQEIDNTSAGLCAFLDIILYTSYFSIAWLSGFHSGTFSIFSQSTYSPRGIFDISLSPSSLAFSHFIYRRGEILLGYYAWLISFSHNFESLHIFILAARRQILRWLYSLFSTVTHSIEYLPAICALHFSFIISLTQSRSFISRSISQDFALSAPYFTFIIYGRPYFSTLGFIGIGRYISPSHFLAWYFFSFIKSLHRYIATCDAWFAYDMNWLRFPS